MFVNNIFLFLGIVLLILAIALPLEDRSVERTYLTNLSIIDQMEGHNFEYWCRDLFAKLGYSNLSVTSGSGDYGVDIIGYNNNERIAIQCKRYNDKVGNKAIQEVFSGAHYYNCNRAIVITNNYFTPQAIDTARNHGVRLIDRNELTSILNNINIEEAKRQPEIQARAKKYKTQMTITKSAFAVVGALLLVYAIPHYNSSDSLPWAKDTEASTSSSDERSYESTISSSKSAVSQWDGWEQYNVSTGEKQKYGDLSITISSLTVKNHLRGLKKYPRADEGNKYINVYLRIRNSTDTKIELKNYFSQDRCWLLVDGDQNLYSANAYKEESFLFYYDIINAGKTYKDIAVCFMVPADIAESDTALAVVFQSDDSSIGNVIWRIR